MQDDTTNTSLPPIAHPDILRRILSFADKPTLVTCLRTHSILFDIAGPSLYHTVNSGPGKLPISLTRVAKGASIIASTSSDGSTPARTNFKSQLLRYVRILEINDHPYCEGPDVRAACWLFESLETLRIIAVGLRAEPFHPALGTCKEKAFCPLNQLRVNTLVMYAPADRWLSLTSIYRPILIRTHSIVLVTGSFSALYQLCRGFQARVIDPKPRGKTEDQGGSVVRILCAATGHHSPIDDKDLYSFLTLLDQGATIYMWGDPDDDFDPGATRIAEENWIPEVNCLNYVITMYNTVYREVTATWSSSSSSSTSSASSPGLLRTRADYLNLPDTHGELDDETMEQIRKDEAEYLRRKDAK